VSSPSSRSVWFGRIVLGGAIALLTRIALGYLVDPAGAVAPHQIVLGSPAALTIMRVSGGMFLGVALALVVCLASGRLLAGLGLLATIATTLTAARLVGLAVDGPAEFTLWVLKPEIALVVLSTAALAVEIRRVRTMETP
jgi:hypothetical protein